jgi:DNA repair protein RadD
VDVLVDQTLHRCEGRMSDLWPHQKRGIQSFQDAYDQGQRQVCLTCPTGGGKTRIACEIIKRFLELDLRVVLYTNRRLLVEQLSQVLASHGLDFGVRAAGYETNLHKNLQIASLQTEQRRVMIRKCRYVHHAQLVIIDEAHLNTGDGIQNIIKTHLEDNACILGLTATPVDLGHIYKQLIVAGTNSELRNCKALLPALHYGPDEPDLKKIPVAEGHDLTEKQNRTVMMRDGIFGRVLESFNRLNPDRLPTILFAPGVPESAWFAQQFAQAGISAAHIDGEDVWVRGDWYRSNREVRQQILDASKAGEIVVLCNRFVLREGIDAPWLYLGILACVFGGLQSYLQSCGRLLRYHESMENVVIQDHGGNWWRHGSVNADRAWDLSCTSSMVTGMRAERMRQKLDREPFRCPQCSMILTSRNCLGCGFVVPPGRQTRPVVQSDGSLKMMVGDIFKPRRISQAPNGRKMWEAMYYRSRTKKGKRTFRQAMALFAYENNWSWPDPTWPLMPINLEDQFRQVAEVPMERLTQ